MSGDDSLVTCDMCGESWWLDYDPAACTCDDGGRWMIDLRVREVDAI